MLGFDHSNPSKVCRAEPPGNPGRFTRAYDILKGRRESSLGSQLDAVAADNMPHQTVPIYLAMVQRRPILPRVQGRVSALGRGRRLGCSLFSGPRRNGICCTSLQSRAQVSGFCDRTRLLSLITSTPGQDGCDYVAANVHVVENNSDN